MNSQANLGVFLWEHFPAVVTILLESLIFSRDS